jgi:hypothetical protein
VDQVNAKFLKWKCNGEIKKYCPSNGNLNEQNMKRKRALHWTLAYAAHSDFKPRLKKFRGGQIDGIVT